MFSIVYCIIFAIYAMFFIGIAAIIIKKTKQTTKEAKEFYGELKRQLIEEITNEGANDSITIYIS